MNRQDQLDWSRRVRDHFVAQMQKTHDAIVGTDKVSVTKRTDLKVEITDKMALTEQELVDEFMPQLHWHNDWPWSQDVAWIRILNNLGFVRFEDSMTDQIVALHPANFMIIGFQAVFVELMDTRFSVIPAPSELGTHGMSLGLVEEEYPLPFTVEQRAEFHRESNLLGLHYQTILDLVYKLDVARNVRDSDVTFQAERELNKLVPGGIIDLVKISDAKREDVLDFISTAVEERKEADAVVQEYYDLFRRCEIPLGFYDHLLDKD
jgi:hypothetical protein